MPAGVQPAFLWQKAVPLAAFWVAHPLVSRVQLLEEAPWILVSVTLAPELGEGEGEGLAPEQGEGEVPAPEWEGVGVLALDIAALGLYVWVWEQGVVVLLKMVVAAAWSQVEVPPCAAPPLLPFHDLPVVPFWQPIPVAMETVLILAPLALGVVPWQLVV